MNRPIRVVIAWSALLAASGRAEAGPLVADLSLPAWSVAAGPQAVPGGSGTGAGTWLNERRRPRDRILSGLAAAFAGGIVVPSVVMLAHWWTWSGPRNNWGFPTEEEAILGRRWGSVTAATLGPLAVFLAMEGGEWPGRALIGTLAGYGAGALLVWGAVALAAGGPILALLSPLVAVAAALAPGLGVAIALYTVPDVDPSPGAAVPGGRGAAPALVAVRF